MFNSNWFKTSLLFLGIIFIGLIASLFLTGDSILVKTDSSEQTANINCLQESAFC